MKKLILIVLLLTINSFIWAQHKDGVTSPIYNSAIKQSQSTQSNSRSRSSNPNNKVVYQFDTLDLPFMDDFSKGSRIRNYSYDPADPGINKEIDIDFTVNGDTINEVIGDNDTTYTYFFNGTAWDSVAKVPLEIIFYDDPNDNALATDTIVVWPFTDSIISGGLLSIDSFAVADTSLINFCDTTFFVPDGTGSIWKSNSVYVNEHYTISPPSLGVVTLDGLDSLGTPYDISSTNTYGIADQFESYPIFLKSKPGGGTYNSRDSVYFSFFYQPQGYGDQPEPEDSLRLLFYSPTKNQWISQWNSSNSSSTDFQQVMIRVLDSNYFQNGFRFKFENYASLSGNFDHWHIDYVRLDADRAFDDVILDDVAFVNESEGLLQDYSQMPWRHFNASPSTHMRSDDIIHTIKNNSDINKFVNYSMTVEDSGNIIFNAPQGSNPNFNSQTEDQKNYERGVFEYPTVANDTNTRRAFLVSSILNTTPDINRNNDTVYFVQNFGTFYAYDDGTAEQAYFVEGAGARIAVRYDIAVEDTLKAVNIHIPRTKDDISNNLFRVKIWSSINPTVLLKESIIQNPSFSFGSRLAFRYEFDEPIVVSDSIYVGIEQQTLPIYIGLDKNFDSQSKNFYSVGGSKWYNASYSGSLLIHPEFGNTYMPYPVGIEDEVEEEQTKAFVIYPNPARDYIQLGGAFSDNAKSIQLYDIQGKLLQEVKGYSGQPISVDTYPAGFYFLRVIDISGQQVFSDKFIIAQ